MKLRNPSPLRYPGGKSSLTSVLEAIIYSNNLQGSTYIEPFAGGAGAAVKLVMEGHVDRILINDLDRGVFSFWWAVMNRTDELIKLVESVPLTVKEWRRQREIYNKSGRQSHVALGFATFFLNRCNRSGIIANAGPIGGLDQTGEWKIDARFNRVALAARIREIADFADRILVTNYDAEALVARLPELVGRVRTFLYADPPYYIKGRDLYMNYYEDANHVSLAETLRAAPTLHWVVTYDDVPRLRELYAESQIIPYSLRYSAHHESRTGGEILVAPRHMTIPPCAIEMLSGGLAGGTLAARG